MKPANFKTKAILALCIAALPLLLQTAAAFAGETGARLVNFGIEILDFHRPAARPVLTYASFTAM